MAWYRPDKWCRVGTWSGSFCNLQYPFNPEIPNGGWDYHSNKKIVENDTSDRSDLRVWLVSCENDFGTDVAADCMFNWTAANSRMAEALKAKKITCHLTHCLDAVHVDVKAFSQTFPSALEWLWETK